MEYLECCQAQQLRSQPSRAWPSQVLVRTQLNLGVCFKSNSVEFRATLQKNYQIKEIHAVLRTQCSFA